jgi:hypothetical protein
MRAPQHGASIPHERKRFRSTRRLSRGDMTRGPTASLGSEIGKIQGKVLRFGKKCGVIPDQLESDQLRNLRADLRTTASLWLTL